MVQSVKKTPKQHIQDAEGTTVNLGPAETYQKQMDDLPRSEHKSQRNHHSFFLPTQDVLQTARVITPKWSS